MESSQSSEYSENSDQYSLEDIHSYLIHKQGRLRSLIGRYIRLDENNFILPEDSEDRKQLLNYKVRFLNCMLNEIRNQREKWRYLPSHVRMDSKRVIKEEEMKLTNLLCYLKNKLEIDRKCLSELEAKISSLQKMKELWEEEAGPEAHSVLEVARKLDVAFKTEKGRLNNLLELFPNRVKDLLQDLCEAYFSDAGDPYISLEGPSSYQAVEMLLESNIVTRHPVDIKKIRLINFSQ